jgi:hypothetical protein
MHHQRRKKEGLFCLDAGSSLCFSRTATSLFMDKSARAHPKLIEEHEQIYSQPGTRTLPMVAAGRRQLNRISAPSSKNPVSFLIWSTVTRFLLLFIVHGWCMDRAVQNLVAHQESIIKIRDQPASDPAAGTKGSVSISPAKRKQGL